MYRVHLRVLHACYGSSENLLVLLHRLLHLLPRLHVPNEGVSLSFRKEPKRDERVVVVDGDG